MKFPGDLTTQDLKLSFSNSATSDKFVYDFDNIAGDFIMKIHTNPNIITLNIEAMSCLTTLASDFDTALVGTPTCTVTIDEVNAPNVIIVTIPEAEIGVTNGLFKTSSSTVSPSHGVNIKGVAIPGRAQIQ